MLIIFLFLMTERQVRRKAKSPVTLVGRCLENSIICSGSLNFKALRNNNRDGYPAKTLSLTFAYTSDKLNERRIKLVLCQVAVPV